MHGAPWVFQPYSRLSLALRGALRLTPATPRKPPRDPYTLTYLRALRPHLDTTSDADLAVWACALCAFWGLLRVGEVTVPTQKTFGPVFHVTRSGWSATPIGAGNAPLSVGLRLPWTKTTRTLGALVVLVGRGDDLCPVHALACHLAARPLPDTAALFSYHQRGRTFPLSRSVFLERLRKAAVAADLPPLHGYSFRIGGCTELLLRGTAIADVKAHG